MSDLLKDKFGRVARKLRISVIDKCNMKCVYCMPQDNPRWYNDNELLTFKELTRLVSIFERLGVEKIRLTGGEPLLRPNLEELVKSFSSFSNIRTISLSTNGILLPEKISSLYDAGIRNINISLDSFNQKKLKNISGISALEKVLNGIYLSKELGINLKINTVVMRGLNDDEVIAFSNFSRNTGIIVRFIEFMPLDGSNIWNNNLVVTKKEIMSEIESKIGKLHPLDNQEKSSPSSDYTFHDGSGCIGFIPSISEPFCNNCDRIRITANGHFLTCLFENPGYDVKSLLRSNQSDAKITRFILNAIAKKPEGIVRLIRKDQLKQRINYMHTIGG